MQIQTLKLSCLILFMATLVIYPQNVFAQTCCPPPKIQNETYCPGECFELDTSPTGHACTPTLCEADDTCIYNQCVGQGDPVPTPAECGTLGLPCCETGDECSSLGLVCDNGICNTNTTVSPSPTPFSFVLNICEGVAKTKIDDCIECMGDSQDGAKVWTAIGCINTNPEGFITDFLKIALGIAGGIALLLMIYGSFLISTSAGDPKKAEEGKEMITGTIAGLLFIIFSVFLLKLIGVDILQIPGF